MDYNELIHWGIKGQKWGIRRYQNKDGSLTPEGRSRRSKNVHDDYRKAHDSKSVKSMSDAELRNRNNRLQMERQYQSFTKKKNRGKQLVQAFISTAGTIAAAEAAYKTYKRIGSAVLDKIGDYVVSDLKKGLSKGL